MAPRIARSASAWVLILALLAGCDVNIQRGGIEPAPKDVRGQPAAVGTEVREFPTREAVQDYCRSHGLDTSTAYSRQRKVRACYDSKNGVIAIIEHGAIPDYEWREEFDHEAAHSHGYVHVTPDGRGWKMQPQNVFAQQAPPVSYDWSNVFRGK